MNIIFASSELTPYVKTGGLGEVSAGLPSALATQGHTVSQVLPLYRKLRESLKGLVKTKLQLHVNVGGQDQLCTVWQGSTGKGVTIFAIQRDEYFDRSGIYGNEEGDYFDNAERFSFFCRAVVELAKHIEPQTDIIHVNDWHAALVPAYVRAWSLPFKTVLTIHSLAYQGSFAGSEFGTTQLPQDYFTPQGVEFYGKLNFLKGGIILAHAVNTVSPRYASEIQEDMFGFGLNHVLREQSYKLKGILNGIDTEEWNPETDVDLAKNFDRKKLLGKAACKKDVMETFGFAEPEKTEKAKVGKSDKKSKEKKEKEKAKTKTKVVKAEGEAPLIGIISRLVAQKGMDLVLESMEQLLAKGIKIVLMGEGEAEYEKAFLKWAQDRPESVAVKIGYDAKLAHKIFAGSDFILVPSLFEPCGLNQMYAQRYGAIPIVRDTGGLADTVKEWDGKTGTGFKFTQSNSSSMLAKIDDALKVYEDKKVLAKVRKHVMEQDYSWGESIKHYESLYQRLLNS